MRMWLPGRRLDTVVNGLAVGSAAMLVGHAATENIPEPFTGVARAGSMAYDLALAYLAAWLFNLLVIEIPRRQDRKKLYRAHGGTILGLTGGATAALLEMGKGAGLPVSEPPTDAEITAVLAVTNPNAQAPIAPPLA